MKRDDRNTAPMDSRVRGDDARKMATSANDARQSVIPAKAGIQLSDPGAQSHARRPGLLPAPITTLALTVAWILLNGFSLGHLLLGLALGLLIPLWVRPLRSSSSRPRRPATIARLTWIVLVDIVQSNIDVARRILGPEKNIRPGWIWVPLEITDQQGIAIFAGIITITPGTLSVDLSPDRKQLLVHCLHIDDPAETIAGLKARYERLLLEIFP